MRHVLRGLRGAHRPSCVITIVRHALPAGRKRDSCSCGLKRRSLANARLSSSAAASSRACPLCWYPARRDVGDVKRDEVRAARLLAFSGLWILRLKPAPAQLRRRLRAVRARDAGLRGRGRVGDAARILRNPAARAPGKRGKRRSACGLERWHAPLRERARHPRVYQQLALVDGHRVHQGGEQRQRRCSSGAESTAPPQLCCRPVRALAVAAPAGAAPRTATLYTRRTH